MGVTHAVLLITPLKGCRHDALVAAFAARHRLLSESTTSAPVATVPPPGRRVPAGSDTYRLRPSNCVESALVTEIDAVVTDPPGAGRTGWDSPAAGSGLRPAMTRSGHLSHPARSKHRNSSFQAPGRASRRDCSSASSGQLQLWKVHN